MKVLAVDYGTKKMGLAISDETGLVTARLPVLRINKEEDKIDGLIYIVLESKPQRIIFGLPSGVNGEVSETGKEILAFVEKFRICLAEALNKLSCEIPHVITWDETYSTKDAEIGKSKKFKHSQSDSEAARLFLQEYLDSPDGLSSIN